MKSLGIAITVILAIPCVATAQAHFSISSIGILDQGTEDESVLSVDVTRDVCDADSETLEQFSETILRLGIYNKSKSELSLVRYRVTVQNPEANGGRYRSRKFNILRKIPVSSELQTTDLLFLSLADGAKQFLGDDQIIPSSLGPRKVTIEVWGRVASKRTERHVVHQTVNFTNLNRCNQ